MSGRKDSGAGSGLVGGGAAATPKTRDFAKISRKESMGDGNDAIPIHASKGPPSVWKRMKVMAFNRMGGKG